MGTSANAKIQIETGQTLNAFAAMTDAGAHTVHTISGGTVWSGKSGYAPDVRPNGVVSGRNLGSPTSSENDKVDVADFTAYSKGVLKTVSTSTPGSITRASSAGVSKVNSVTMTDAGVIAVVVGTQGATAAFSEVRDAAGGPPLIPADSVELFQVRTTSSTAGEIDDDEIFQVDGTHFERFDSPTWEENNTGDGNAAATAGEKNAHIKFESALAASHTGPLAKKAYIKYYAPIMSDQSRALNFTPVEKSHSANSESFYGGSVASKSESLGQGGFTALLNDGITDSLVTNKNQVLTVKHYSDENKAPYILSQGAIALKRTYPEANQNKAVVTITAEQESAEFSS